MCSSRKNDKTVNFVLDTVKEDKKNELTVNSFSFVVSKPIKKSILKKAYVEEKSNFTLTSSGKSESKSGSFTSATNESSWGEAYTDGRFSTETTNIVDNYLASLRNTAENLRTLLDQFAALNEPVAVVIYGDHRPWMGNGNSAYTELGIDLDTSGTAGLYNKYSTDYVIWANDAAKAVTGNDFRGQGPDLSPNFLMNQLFALCGWKGNAYMQATEEIRQQMPVITTIGRFWWDGEYYREADLPEEARALLQRDRKSVV